MTILIHLHGSEAQTCWGALVSATTPPRHTETDQCVPPSPEPSSFFLISDATLPGGRSIHYNWVQMWPPILRGYEGFRSISTPHAPFQPSTADSVLRIVPFSFHLSFFSFSSSLSSSSHIFASRKPHHYTLHPHVHAQHTPLPRIYLPAGISFSSQSLLSDIAWVSSACIGSVDPGDRQTNRQIEADRQVNGQIDR